MSEEVGTEDDAAAVAQSENQDARGAGAPSGDQGSAEKVPDFQQQTSRPTTQPGKFQSKRFGGVQVSLTAHLGRAKVTIQELAALTEGAVIELDREIGEPVELVAQGVPLGNGEVVVVDDRFAVRIKEIYQT
ncbi:FliM/FliN family flagellar motor switch protein [Stieleria varia]|uniref:Flagellar motor switch protein FliN n=1 Tax=Stieleria varia TaxID=2528005 RepID=A0A5C6ARP2_9BACT|nr:FliM/FliN family flagellar motor switch protein [Stieleria varia]TWU02370.1 Flagellar motor switch protein FliN [Stieleria varia]